MNDSQTEGLSARIAARLKQARDDLGMTLAEASRKMGFENYQVLMNIEKGERAVKASELVKFCEIYLRHLEFFLLDQEPGPSPAVVWRSRGEDTAARRVERAFMNYCEDYARLETFADGSPTVFRMKCAGPVSGYNDAFQLGESIGKQLELGTHPAQLLARVLEEDGVKVMVLRAPTAGSAASAKGPFGAGIFLNSSNARWRINFDLAHELFHLLTWGQSNSAPAVEPGEGKPLNESLADSFASALLLPEAVIVKEFRGRVKDAGVSFVDCVNMARDFGVSTEALIWRFVNLRLIGRDAATKALESPTLKDVDRSIRQKDRRQSDVEWPTPRFVATAFKCLQLGKLSRGRFAQLMGIRRGEIDHFLAVRGYDAWEDYSGEISTA